MRNKFCAQNWFRVYKGSYAGGSPLISKLFFHKDRLRFCDKIIFDDFEAATESCGGSYKLIANQLINFVIAKLGRLNQLAVNSFQFNLFDVRS